MRHYRIDNLIDDFTNYTNYFNNPYDGDYSLIAPIITNTTVNVVSVLAALPTHILFSFPTGLPLVGLPQTDLAGNPRITNGKSNYGAYEFEPTNPPFNHQKQWKSMDYNDEEENQRQEPPMVQKMAGGKWQIYPNPTTGQLRITNYGSTTLTDPNRTPSVVEVYDIYGKCHVARVTRNEIIDVSHLATGIYFLRITTEDGMQQTKKFVKQ